MNQQAKELNSLIEQVSQRVVDRTINEKYLISRMAVIVNSFDESTNTASIIIPTDLSTPTQYKYPNRTGRRKLNYGDKVYLIYQTNNISQGWLEDNKGFTGGGGGYSDFRFVKGRAITLYDTDGVTPLHSLLPENILFYDGTDASSDLFNYNRLENKPQINGHTLAGNQSDTDLGLNVTSSKVTTALGYTPAVSGYGACSTAAATRRKAVTVSPDFKLQAGAIVGIKYTYTNTASSPTLNVNSKGAKNIYYNNAQVTTSNLTIGGYAGRMIYYMYDGTQWRFLSWDYDANNTYSTISETDIKSSSNTTAGLITGQRYKQAFDSYLTSSAITTALTYTPVSGVKGNSESSYRTGNVNITKANIGLGNVENKSSATIRGELTASNVTDALGYTPSAASNAYQAVGDGSTTTISDGVIELVPLKSTGAVISGSGMSVSTYGIKVSSAGVYRITGSVYLYAPAEANSYGVYIKKSTNSGAFINSSEIGGVLYSKGATQISTSAGFPSRIYSLAANDVIYLAVRIRGSSSGNYQPTNAMTYLLVEKIS